MIGKLLLLVLAIFAWFWFKSWYRGLKQAEKKKALWNIGIITVIVVMFIGVAAGRMHWAGLALASVAGMAKFLLGNAVRFAPFFFATARKQNFSTPEFKTEYLNVKIRFGNQTQLEGSIINGPHKGKTLQELSSEELLELANYYKEKCKRSYYLILVVIQKSGANQQQHKVEDNSNITRDEAIQILGLSENFSPEDVKLAHRRLMQKLHPDKGGNEWLASRINLAKETLLRS